VLGDKPLQFGPAFERYNITSSRLGQAFEAGFRGQGNLHSAAPKQEANLLRSSVLKFMSLGEKTPLLCHKSEVPTPTITKQGVALRK
jgi:hypothetical protein